MNKDFKYEITEKIAVLSTYGTQSKELNKVSYNGAPAKYDLRVWERQGGNERLLKGITLNETELKALKEAICKL